MLPAERIAVEIIRIPRPLIAEIQNNICTIAAVRSTPAHVADFLISVNLGVGALDESPNLLAGPWLDVVVAIDRPANDVGEDSIAIRERHTWFYKLEGGGEAAGTRDLFHGDDDTLRRPIHPPHFINGLEDVVAQLLAL
jgi:hypothetical protein